MTIKVDALAYIGTIWIDLRYRSAHNNISNVPHVTSHINVVREHFSKLIEYTFLLYVFTVDAVHTDVYISCFIICGFDCGLFLYVSVIMSTYFRFGYGMCDNAALASSDNMSQASMVPIP